MSLFNKTEAYLGVDIGAHGIKMVELHKTKGRPQLWTYGIAEEDLDIHLPEVHDKSPEELLSETDKILGTGEKDKKEKKPVALPQLDDPRIDKYAKFLKELAQKTKITTTKSTASLPVSYLFHAILNLPKVEDKELDHVVMAEVKKMLPRPIEEMQVVHQKIPDDKEAKSIRVLVTAAPKILVQFYSNIFSRAGLELQELETEAFALERSLVGRDQATVMVVDIGAERTNFFIMEKGLPLTHRSISQGGKTIDKALIKNLGIAEEDVSQIKKDITKLGDKVSKDIFIPTIDAIVKEIDYNFDLFLSQTGNENKKPEKIILTGGSSVMPFFKNEISKQFPMKVFVGDPWARTIYQDGLKKNLDKIGPRMSVSIGLALRNIVG